MILEQLRQETADHLTMTWGATASTAQVATMVKVVKKRRHRRSNTIAANFQSPAAAEASSSSFILSVMILISFRIRPNSRCSGDVWPSNS